MERLRGQEGYTIVEVIIAATLLVVGVLGTAQLVNVANGAASDANGREGANSIARRVVEVARRTPGRSLAQASITTTLSAAAPDLPDSSPAAGWTITRQGYTYTVVPTVCTTDDPGDGTGTAASRDASYCALPATTSPADAQPADYQRVTVTVTWRPQSRPSQVKQVVSVPMGISGSLPSVSALAMRTPTVCASTCPAITNSATTSTTFDVTTTNAPSTLTWLVDNNPMGTCPPTSASCTGSANAWSFTWGLGTVAKDATAGSINLGKCIAGNYVYDGSYQVGAYGSDANGLSAGPNSMSVSLNRCAAIPPASFKATGRNANTTLIDTEWQDNPEGDIVGYRVYKGATLASRTPVCPAVVSGGQFQALDQPTECTDTAPPAYSGSAYYYAVVAIDRDSTGALREGATSYYNVNMGNRAPNAPTAFALTATAQGPKLTWTLPATLDPDAGDTIESFRIYRKNGVVAGTPAWTDRYDRESLANVCTGTSCSYTDTGAGATTHTYWITPVDNRLREGAYQGPKSG